MIAWSVETLIASTLLMLLVLGTRGIARRRFGPSLAYALWLLPAARIVLPPLPGDWGFSRLLGPAVRSAQDGPGVVMGVLNTATAPAQAIDSALFHAELASSGRAAGLALVPPTIVEGGPSIAVLLVGVWVVGAIAFLGYHMVAHRRYCSALLRRAGAEAVVAGNKVRVIETDAAHGPLAFGVWRKYVAFPRDFAERYDPLERDLALAHELGHHARGDLIANWAALVVLALHWFNPVAWAAYRAFRADQELACDALVLAGRPAALRHAYGRAIVKSAHGGAVSAACHLHTVNDLKGRLKMLSLHHTASRARTMAGTLAIASATLIGLGATASGTRAAERVRDRVEQATGVERAAVGAPAMVRPLQAAVPPAPAAPPAAAAPALARSAPVPPAAPAPAARTKVMIAGKPVNGAVVEERCGAAAGGSFVINRKVGDKTVMVICTDSIEKVTSDATAAAGKASTAAAAAAASGVAASVDAAGIQRNALTAALAGLRGTRAALANNPDLSGEARTEALAGVDEGIAEIEAELGSKD